MSKLYLNLKRDGLLYSRKRKEVTKTFIASIVSIVLALIVALLIATAMGYNPFIIIERLFTIGFGDPTYLFYKIGVFAIAGFAFYFAWKCGIINIGISGQMLLSGTIIVLLTQQLGDKIPNGAGQVFIIVIGMLIGSLTATFVGALQTYLKVNAIVASILLNWIIYFLCFFILATYTIDASEQFVSSGEIGINYCLIDQSTNTGGIIPIVVIIVLLAIIMIVVFKYTVFGHKIKSIGLSKDASLYAGYNVKLYSLSSYAISGAISGILACVCYTSSSVHAIPLSTFFDAVPTEGFDGIMISLVGNNNPIGIVLSSGLFGLFGASAQGLPTDPSFNNVIVGCVLLGSAMSVILYKTKPWIKLNSFKYDLNYNETQITYDNSMDSLLSKYHSILSSEKNNIKEIKKNKDLDKLLYLINEHKLNINLTNDKSLYTNIKEYRKVRLVQLQNKYKNEKNHIHDQFNYSKLLDLINSRLLTDDIINKKKNIIENKYDNKLTMYVNKLKRKEENFIKKHNNNQNACDRKVETYKKYKANAIEKNNKWKTREINRVIKYQNKYLKSIDSINHQIKYIESKINNIKNVDYQNEIRNLLLSVNQNEQMLILKGGN